MFNSQGHLNIFEDFKVDRDLPKFRRPTRDDQNESFGDDDGSMSENQFMRTRHGGFNITGSTNGINTFAVTTTPGLPEFQPTWLQGILIRLLSWVTPEGKALVFRPLTDPPGPPPEITIHEFFSSVKNSQEDLEVVDGRARGYEAALERAHKTGQKALAEQLEAGVQAVRAETQLHTLGLTRTLTEATLVEFVKKSPKGLRLDWVKNFTRVIPDEVLATKVACDERGVFDNYVVLHYDPDAKSWAETQAETAARKDPILFGLIGGRRTLYFVGEWVDEFCDLSLDQIADVLYEDMEVRPGTATTDLDLKNFGAVGPTES